MSETLKLCATCGQPAQYTSVDGQKAIGYPTRWCQCSNESQNHQQVWTVDVWQSRPLEDALRAELEAARARCAELAAENERMIREALAVDMDDVNRLDAANQRIAELEKEVNYWLEERGQTPKYTEGKDYHG